jgi:hypothetical protein
MVRVSIILICFIFLIFESQRRGRPCTGIIQTASTLYTIADVFRSIYRPGPSLLNSKKRFEWLGTERGRLFLCDSRYQCQYLQVPCSIAHLTMPYTPACYLSICKERGVSPSRFYTIIFSLHVPPVGTWLYSFPLWVQMWRCTCSVSYNTCRSQFSACKAPRFNKMFSMPNVHLWLIDTCMGWVPSKAVSETTNR